MVEEAEDDRFVRREGGAESEEGADGFLVGDFGAGFEFPEVAGVAGGAVNELEVAGADEGHEIAAGATEAGHEGGGVGVEEEF